MLEQGGVASAAAELSHESLITVLTFITNAQSVFYRHDIALTFHRYINNEARHSGMHMDLSWRCRHW